MVVVWCRSCSRMWRTHRLAHRPRLSGHLWQGVLTKGHLCQELCGFLFTPILPWTCVVTYPWSYIGVKVESQHSRLDQICSWFLFKSSEIELKLVELCAFGALKNKAFGLCSLKRPICWDWSGISSVCAGVLDEGFQKVLAIKFVTHSKANPSDKLLYRNQAWRSTAQLCICSKAGMQNGIEKWAVYQHQLVQ